MNIQNEIDQLVEQRCKSETVSKDEMKAILKEFYNLLHKSDIPTVDQVSQMALRF